MTPDAGARALTSESLLVGAAIALGARDVPGWSDAETAAAEALGAASPPHAVLAALRAGVAEGADPLGAAFCLLRDPERRRPDGATYTPSAIVESMVAWAATEAAPGSYSGPTGFRETRGPVGEAKLSTLAQDATLAGLLWERSEELTGISVTP